MDLTPRANFIKSPHKRYFHDAVATDWFHAAVETALVEMQLDLKAPADMATAASYQWRMEGAKQFTRLLMRLTETGEKPPPKPDPNLDHKI